MVIVGVVTATVVGFVLSAALYGAPPVAALVTATSTPRPGIGPGVQVVSVLARGLVAAVVLAVLLHAGDRSGAGPGASLGALVSMIPVAILSGAIVHEGVPVRTALVHMTDWVLKLIVSGALVGLFV